MKIKYGSFTTDDYECEVTISGAAEFDDQGYRTGTRWTWTLSGIAHGDTVADVTTAINDRLDAFAVQDQDLYLLTVDGSETAHKLLSSETLDGVRVLSIAFPQGAGAEYTTYRHYTVTIEGTILEAESSLLQWTESITRTGTAGPRHVWLETIAGPPVRQQVAAATTCRIVQSGSATGLDGYPVDPISGPGSLFPGLEHFPQRSITVTAPSLSRGKLRNWKVDWTYVHEAAGVPGGLPRSQF